MVKKEIIVIFPRILIRRFFHAKPPVDWRELTTYPKTNVTIVQYSYSNHSPPNATLHCFGKHNNNDRRGYSGPNRRQYQLVAKVKPTLPMNGNQINPR